MKKVFVQSVAIALFSTVLALASSGLAIAQVQVPAGMSLDVQIPSAPIPVKADGKVHLAYELHITNFRGVDLALTRVEVTSGDNTAAVLADYRDAALSERLARPGARPDLADKRVIAGGMRAVVFVWLTLEETAVVPAKLLHRISFNLMRPTGSEAGAVEGVQTSVRKEAPIVIDMPLRGGPWVAGFGPSNDAGHRRTILPLDGRARIPQRFAIDWMKLGDDGKPARGDASKITNWYGYGAEVLAVADSRVAGVKDGVSETPSLGVMPTTPIKLEDAGGNYVSLDLGNGRFAFYGHLQPGSIRVKVGDRVRSGQVIGLVGHSGNSTAPHLHFHVSDSSAALAAEGVPYVFKGFEVLGAVESSEALDRNEQWKPQPGAAPRSRRMEIPLDKTVVRFR
ncbi:MAG TPA: M23 family metallopeptidase [Blastocatellia bacterium]|nr:M23 family metallopeptidase [Blastocatellia bacterium]